MLVADGISQVKDPLDLVYSAGLEAVCVLTSQRVRKGLEQVMDFALIAVSVHPHVKKFVDTFFPICCSLTDASQRIWWSKQISTLI